MPRARVKRGEGAEVDFAVTDTLKTVPVSYRRRAARPLPRRPGRGGGGQARRGGAFVADTVLAKHDETYMPPEVAKALEAKGVKLGKGATHPRERRSQDDAPSGRQRSP